MKFYYLSVTGVTLWDSFFAVLSMGKVLTVFRRCPVKLTHAILFMFLSLSGSFAMAETALEAQPVGKVIFATGGASLQPESGAAVKGQVGTPVYEGEMLSTGAASHMHIQMMDGALLVLRPESAIRIAYYHVDLVQPANTKILLDMQKGVIRSVTGKGGKANKQGFRLNTPVAAIGIKGTDFTVLATANLASITLREGGVAVSPFSSLCPRYAVGACSGSQTVMLTAADQQMLAEVRAAKAVRVPKINAEVVPDKVAPVHPAEEKSLQDAKDAPITIGSTTSTGSATPVVTSTSTQASNSTPTGTSTTQQGSTQTGTATATTGNTAGSTTLVKSGNTQSVPASIAGGNAESASSVSGLTNVGGVSSDKVKVSDEVKFAPAGAGLSSGPTAEVASLSPVTAEVGPKDSVTSELASRIVAEKTPGAINAALTPPVSTPAVSDPTPAKPQPFYWGRWSSYAENPEQVIVRDPVKNKQIFAANQVYLLADGEAGAPQLPKSGKVAFNLDKGEAGILKEGTFVKASISAASLEANFDNNRFKTGLTVNSDMLTGGAVALTAEGGLSPSTGTFRNDTALSTMSVSGALSEGAQHAAYEFNDPNNNIVGVTSWQH
jgi:hypothetical protein